MDVLIKRKSFKEALDCLNDMSNENDWNLILNTLTENLSLADFLIEYLRNIQCVSKLKLFLVKLFSANLSDKNYALYLYNLINELCLSESKLFKHEAIRNIIYIQSVKIFLFDPNQYKANLWNILSTEEENSGWFLELMNKLEMNETLGDFYLNRKEYEKSLNYYKIGGYSDKITDVMCLLEGESGVEFNLLNRAEINGLKDN
jgi:hypothetical protein